jgi:tight adherence protein B
MQRRRTRRAHRPLLALGLAAGALLVALPPGVAGAETPDDRLEIVAVDTSDFPEVTVTVAADPSLPGASSWEILEDGQLIEATSEPGSSGAVMVVIDASASMATSGALQAAQQAVAAWASSMPDDQSLGVVSFADDATLVVAPTTDGTAIGGSVAGIQPGTGDALVDGVLRAIQQLDGGGTIVIVTDGVGEDAAPETGSLAEALAAADAAGIELSAIAVDGGGTLAPLEALGLPPSATAGPPADVVSSGLAAEQTRLASVTELRWVSDSQAPSIDVAISVGGARAIRTAPTGLEVAMPDAIVPSVSGPSFLQGSTGRTVVVVTVLVAVGALVAALMMIFMRRPDDIVGRLSIYTDDAARQAAADESSGSFAETGVMRRAVELTEGFAVKHGLLDKVGAKLDQADLPLRPAEALLLYAFGVLGGAVFGLLLLGGMIGAIFGLAFGVVGPQFAIKYLRAKRLKKFMSQLPDTLTLLSSTLRAGYSLVQGVETVAQETEDPMARELQRVIVEHRLGRPLEEALEDMAKRMDSNDFEWAVMAIRIQREVGGNLAELLQTVSETMVLRERMRREVKALTAEGTISALVLGLLPVGLGGIMYMVAPDYIGKLFEETVGQIMLVACGISMAAGLAWMRKIITIDA